MILSFKPQFKAPILAGTKIHTIREDKPGRWKPGIYIHFATGVRTKNYECFYKEQCKSTQHVEIYMVKNTVTISIDFRVLEFDEMIAFAKNDGFNDLPELCEWFKPIAPMHGGVSIYRGILIHWTGYRY